MKTIKYEVEKLEIKTMITQKKTLAMGSSVYSTKSKKESVNLKLGQ
jgi:hypothetical protein